MIALKLKLTLISILLFPLLLTSCKESEKSETEESILQTTFILRDVFNQESDSYVQGENIEFYLTLTNISNKEVRLIFGDSQQYDFYINSILNTEVWRWSDDKVFTTALTELVIQAEETIVINDVWDQTLAGGDGIPTGNYTAYGSFFEHTTEAKFDFTIQ